MGGKKVRKRRIEQRGNTIVKNLDQERWAERERKKEDRVEVFLRATTIVKRFRLRAMGGNKVRKRQKRKERGPRKKSVGKVEKKGKQDKNDRKKE